MRGVRLDRWLPVGSLVAAGVVLFFMGQGNRSQVGTIGIVVLLAAVVWWIWPTRRGAHTPHAEAQAAASADDVIVYWRPG